MTVFCILTLLVILFAGCGATSKEEEIFDTLLLVTRNVLQFGRLANIVRQYVSDFPVVAVNFNLDTQVRALNFRASKTDRLDGCATSRR